MASGDRFYQLEFRNREVLHGDIGSLLRVEGLVVGGCSAQAILMLPGTFPFHPDSPQHQLSIEQWSEYLRRSDDPEVLVMPVKAFHRKLRYEISGAVQQKVWVADGLKCMYCGQPMGKVQLTIDHFTPLELGGENNQSNYLSACRRCNKDKGSEDPKVFCNRRGLSYDGLVNHLANREIK
jgi:5-methylcytosine-specific restriction endonuclease McrA